MYAEQFKLIAWCIPMDCAVPLPINLSPDYAENRAEVCLRMYNPVAVGLRVDAFDGAGCLGGTRRATKR